MSRLLAILRALRGPRFRFERNPYRRWCVACGQRQERYCWAGDWNRGWWETNGAIKDADCACHGVLHREHRPRTWMEPAP